MTETRVSWKILRPRARAADRDGWRGSDRLAALAALARRAATPIIGYRGLTRRRARRYRRG